MKTSWNSPAFLADGAMERCREGLRYLLKLLLAIKRLPELERELQALCKEVRERRQEVPIELTLPKIGRSLSEGEVKQTSERSSALLPEDFSSKELESFLPPGCAVCVRDVESSVSILN